MLRLDRPFSLLVAALLLTACGGSVESKNSPHDGGLDRLVPLPEAGADADANTTVPDAAPDAPSDAAPDAPATPALGAACNGQNGNPSSCNSGLTCYTGQNNPNEQGRWPGGYCTTACQGDATCAPYGGVCAGAQFGGGRCLQSCTKPTDCRQGYACRNVSFQGVKMACAPTGFIATRDAGVACFQHDDPSQPYYAPLLKDSHFGASQQVDTTSFSSDEIAFARNASDQIVVGANTIAQNGYDNPSMHATGATLPLSFTKNAGPRYSSAAYYSDPYIVSDADGSFYYSTLGLNQQATMAWLVVGHSTDGGKTWQSVKANPDSDCNGTLGGQGQGPCLDHPWLAAGKDILKPGKTAIYAAYLATRGNNDYPTVLIRSTDGGQTWGTPGSPGTTGAPGNSLAVFGGASSSLYTNLITPTVDASGVVHMVATAVLNDPKGSTQNVVFYAQSTDGGKTRTAPQAISIGYPVPFEQPVIATDNGNIYVAFVAGMNKGAWDIVLASSTDNGKTWNHLKVNDEPSPCATNFHPAIAVDHSTHKVYVAWYDGRFAPYEGFVALTVCTPDTSGKMTCTPNEAINDKPFYITTDRNDLTFLGDYFTLHVEPGGKVWAGWGDTRLSGTTHAFIATGTVP